MASPPVKTIEFRQACENIILNYNYLHACEHEARNEVFHQTGASLHSDGGVMQHLPAIAAHLQEVLDHLTRLGF